MSEKVKTYKELLIWQKGIELVRDVYRITRMFPKEETYALCDQVRRSAVSVPSNIAEGQARQHTGEFRQFLFVALGSLAELDTQLVIANKLEYLSLKEMNKLGEQIEELRKMIRGLLSKLTTAHTPLTTNKGFTLVELLIAMAIASVVGMAGVSLFSTSNWAYKVNEDVAEAQQNGRVAMDRLAKDIRTAGFGLPDPPFSLTIGTGTFTAPITVTNSSTGPDTITILGIGYEAGTLNRGTETDCNLGATSKICLDSVASTNNFFTESPGFNYIPNRRYISLNGSTFIELSNTQIERANKKLTLGTPSTLDRSYPDGTPVYIIQAVQYTVNNLAPFLGGCSALNPCLASLDFTGLRGGNGNDRQVLAENIEDIQFAYGVDADRDGRIDSNGTDYRFDAAAETLADPTSIIAIRAWVVAKARNKDMRGSTFTRPVIEDHSVGVGDPDNYRRRILTKVIKLRNPRTGG